MGEGSGDPLRPPRPGSAAGSAPAILGAAARRGRMALARLAATGRELRARLTGPEARSLLRWCLPALVAAVILRGALVAHLPKAFFHDDTRFVLKPAEQIAEGGFELDPRRPFLVPILYAVPLALRLPFLETVAVGQHLLGLGFILLAGVLCRWWFRRWRPWTAAVTLLFALNPVLLWYEHVALPEVFFLYGTFAALVAGVWFWREPRPLTFAALFAVLLLNSGTRPEGQLLLPFGVLLAARVYWGRWRQFALALLLALALAGIGFKVTRTGQGGKLLLTTLLPYLPDQLRCEPGLGARLEPLRQRTRAEWCLVPSSFNTTRKEVERTVRAYLREECGVAADQADGRIDGVCRRVARETVLRDPLPTIGLAARKFLVSLKSTKLRDRCCAIPAGPFDAGYAYREQTEFLIDGKGQGWGSSYRWTTIYFGEQPATPAAIQALLERFYPTGFGDWLTRYQEGYFGWFFRWSWPAAELLPGIPGVPVAYLAAVVGLLALSVRRRPVRWPNEVHLWLVTLGLLAYAIFLTGNMVSRYRMVFEPYWWLGLAGLAEALLAGAAGVWRRRSGPRERAGG